MHPTPDPRLFPLSKRQWYLQWSSCYVSYSPKCTLLPERSMITIKLYPLSAVRNSSGAPQCLHSEARVLQQGPYRCSSLAFYRLTLLLLLPRPVIPACLLTRPCCTAHRHLCPDCPLPYCQSGCRSQPPLGWVLPSNLFSVPPQCTNGTLTRQFREV